MREDEKMRLRMTGGDGFLSGMADGSQENAGPFGPEAPETDDREDMDPARQLEARRHAEVREFLAVFPEAARGPIPQEVWNAVNQGFSLTAAYARYQRMLQQRMRAAAGFAPVGFAGPAWSPVPLQNALPASTGSMRSAGYVYGPKDPFLDGLEGDW